MTLYAVALKYPNGQILLPCYNNRLELMGEKDAIKHAQGEMDHGIEEVHVLRFETVPLKKKLVKAQP